MGRGQIGQWQEKDITSGEIYIICSLFYDGRDVSTYVQWGKIRREGEVEDVEEEGR